MELTESTLALLKNIGTGKTSSTAYDTAWVARLAALDEPIGKQALAWLRENQLPDGGWGAPEPRYNHDRLISTLSAMSALSRQGDEKDKPRLRRALMAMDMAARGLPSDASGETDGFEMIIPGLLKEIKELGLSRRSNDDDLLSLVYEGGRRPFVAPASSSNEWGQDANFLAKFSYKREAKLQMLSDYKINRQAAAGFSAEMVGADGISLLDVENLSERNGSIAHSPAPTAHFALYVKPGDPAALAYLRQAVTAHADEGGAPNAAPLDTLEQAWVLWNLALPGNLDEATRSLCQPHLDALQTHWVPGEGAGYASGMTLKDGGNTGLVYAVLTRYGLDVDFDAVLQYERITNFECFALETSPSVSANISILMALHQEGLEADHPSVQKIVNFLEQTRHLGMFWFDKSHVSPYFPTCQVLIAAEKADHGLEASAVEWLLATQNKTGSWGYYNPTAEETAYALQALFVWKRKGNPVPQEQLKRGLGWLAEYREPPYQPLWARKCLYSPHWIVQSAILSALTFGRQENYI